MRSRGVTLRPALSAKYGGTRCIGRPIADIGMSLHDPYRLFLGAMICCSGTTASAAGASRARSRRGRGYAGLPEFDVPEFDVPVRGVRSASATATMISAGTSPAR
jgi:hypothetical protein